MKPWEMNWDVKTDSYDGSFLQSDNGENVQPIEKLDYVLDNMRKNPTTDAQKDFWKDIIKVESPEEEDRKLNEFKQGVKDYFGRLTTFEVKKLSPEKKQKTEERVDYLKQQSKKALEGEVKWGEVGKYTGRTALELTKGAGGFMRAVGDWWQYKGGNEDLLPSEKKKMELTNYGALALEKTGQWIEDMADMGLTSDLLELDPEIFKGSFLENPSLTRTLSVGFSSIPSLTTMYGVSRIAGSTLAVGLMSGIDVQDIYWGAKEAGKNPNEAATLFAIAGIGTYKFEKIGFDSIFGKKVVPLAEKIVAGMASEGLTEGAQTIYQNAVKKIGYDRAQDLLEGVIEAVIAGSVGGFLGAGVVGTTRMIGGETTSGGTAPDGNTPLGAMGMSEKLSRAEDALRAQGYTTQDINTMEQAIVDEIANHNDSIETMFQDNINKSLNVLGQIKEKFKNMPEEKRMQISRELEEGYGKYYRELSEIMPEEQARSNAALIRNQAFFMSDLMGITPKEYFDKFAPKIKKAKFADFGKPVAPKRYELSESEMKNIPIPQLTQKDINYAKSHPEWKKNAENIEMIERAGASIDDSLETINNALRQYATEDYRYRKEKAQEHYDVIASKLTEEEQERLAMMTEGGMDVDEAYSQIKGLESDTEGLDLTARQEGFNRIFLGNGQSIYLQESQKLSENMEKLDNIYPAYEGETININGQEKTVYNSNGDRIAKSKEALENFYKWFGDSKVVDEQGRPLVVYHNSAKQREILSREYARTTMDIQGVFFAAKPDPYGEYGPAEHKVYLKIENPADFKKAYEGFDMSVIDAGIAQREKLQSQGYDGAILTEDGKPYEFIAFESNQIKSTSNRGTYSESDNIYYQEKVSAKTNRENPTRIKQRTIENLLPEEKEAFDRFIASRKDGERILRNLEKNKYDNNGNITGYYRTVVEDVFIQQAIMDYVNGKEVNYESAIDVKTRQEGGAISTIKQILQSNEFKSKKSAEEKIAYLADSYIDGASLAHPAKVVNAVNSSLLNCNPSKACAIFCYATHGNYIRGSYSMPKSEVIDIVARYHPKKLAQMIAKEYKMTTEYNMGKALRLFDKGDGDDHWVEVAKELNNEGVRVAIFTKRPDFMRKINELKTKDGKEINLTMLSIDSSNENLARENKDLNVAYVYQGEQNIEFVKDLQESGRLNVVLPVKLDGKTMSRAEVEKLRENGIQTKKICPIDAGWLKTPEVTRRTPANVVAKGQLKPAKVGTWNCALCDRMGGVGCYFGKTTEELISYLQDVGKNDLNLKEKDVNIIINGFEEILKKQNITEGLTNEQLKQFGITEQDIENRIRFLSPTMGESNARAFAGYSLLLSWFGQRHTDVQRSAQNKATKAGLLQSENRPTTEDNEQARELSKRGATEERESADSARISSDLSEDSGANVRLNKTQFQEGQIPQGAYANDTIYLFENADESSLPHELSHRWDRELRTILAETGSERVKNMLEQVDAWEESEFKRKFNVVKRENGYAVVNKRGDVVYDNRGNGFLTEEDAKDYAKKELFARGFEQYLREGKAPNNSLKQAFRNFFMWLKKIYRDAMDLNIQLSPDIKNVYADILGGVDIDFFLDSTPESFIQQRIKLGQEKEATVNGIIQDAVANKKQIVKNKSGKGFSEIWTKAMIPLSTRAKRISPKLRNLLRRYEFTLSNELNKKYAKITPFLNIWKKMDEDDAIAFDLALKNDYVPKQLEIVDKYNARKEWEAVRETLENIFDEAINAGLDIGYRPDYFPRKVKDVDGFLSYIHNVPEWTRFQQAIDEAGLTSATAEEQAEFINKYLRGFNKVDIMPNKYGSEKERTIDIIDNDINKFYAPSIEALVSYVEGLNSRVVSANYLGKGENLEESIGGYLTYLLNNNIIEPSQIDEVRDILSARFGARGVSNRWLANARNYSYMYTMGGINSAITQIEDLSVSMYKAGVWNTITTAMEAKRITKKDLGLESISAEFVEQSKSGELLNKLFKLTGLDAIDSLGKETLVNAELKKFQKMSDETLREYLEPIMEEETNATIKDIKEGNISDNVLYLVFSELSDVQPISLSELPEFYNKGGNLRVLYMLKSFAVKRIDTFRNECYDKLRSKDANVRKEGLQNLFKLAALMVLCGATKDWLIDLMYGRDTSMPETLLNNILGLVGLSKFQIYQAKEKGFTGTVKDIVAPPLYSFFDDLFTDVVKVGQGKRKIKDMEVWKGIPLVGRFYYWWAGRGREKMNKKSKKKY